MRSLVLAGLVASLLVRSASADDGDRWDGATLGVQTGVGVGGAVIGGVGLGATGLLIGYAVADRSNWGPPLAGAAGGFVLGAFVGLVVGVQLGGDAREGTGHWYGTLGGAAVGTAAVVGLALATERQRGYEKTKAAGFFLLVVGTTLVGYHLSADAHASTGVPLTLRF